MNESMRIFLHEWQRNRPQQCTSEHFIPSGTLADRLAYFRVLEVRSFLLVSEMAKSWLCQRGTMPVGIRAVSYEASLLVHALRQ
jgi:hypothetical protein